MNMMLDDCVMDSIRTQLYEPKIQDMRGGKFQLLYLYFKSTEVNLLFCLIRLSGEMADSAL